MYNRFYVIDLGTWVRAGVYAFYFVASLG